MTMLDAESRDDAVDRMVAATGMDRKRAVREIQARVRSIKCLIALWGYRSWAQEHALLLGGPTLNSVNYERVRLVLQNQCYGVPGAPLHLGLWDLIDLSNARMFEQYANQLLVPYTLPEILLLKRREWDTLKSARPSLVSQRKKLNATHAT